MPRSRTCELAVTVDLSLKLSVEATTLLCPWALRRTSKVSMLRSRPSSTSGGGWSLNTGRVWKMPIELDGCAPGATPQAKSLRRASRRRNCMSVPRRRISGGWAAGGAGVSSISVDAISG